MSDSFGKSRVEDEWMNGGAELAVLWSGQPERGGQIEVPVDLKLGSDFMIFFIFQDGHHVRL